VKNGFVQSMAWLHTWAGLVVGWVLFVIFFGGTVACFDKELDYWMSPALHGRPPAPASLDAADAAVRRDFPDASMWYLRPPTARAPMTGAFVIQPGKPFEDFNLDPADGSRIPGTVGGDFFFALHYDLQAGTAGIYLVGLAGMLMLAALVSGVVIHRRLFKDFFVFRPRGGAQRAWLDGHNLTAVLGLPFHLMIAYTGVAIMVSSYMPAGVQVAYDGNVAAFFQALSDDRPRAEQHRPPPRRASLDAILADARRRLGGEALYLEIENPRDAAITVAVTEAGDGQVAGGARTLAYDGVDGRFLRESRPPAAAYRVYQFLGGLHRVQFGGAPFRWLYFLLGAAGCAMLACGMQVWVEKRAKAVAAAGIRSGYGLVRALNVGVVAGLPLASVALLWANRLLPADLAGRAGAEARIFVLAWLAALAWGVARLRGGRPWRELFGATAAGLLLLPLLNAARTPASALPASLARGDWRLAGVDLTVLALGLLFAWLGWRCGRSRSLRARAAAQASA
jgi:uncharacterized iron-regulated membrane protein